MATLQNTAEGGSNTTLVSAANSGGSSGDAWSSVNRGSAASAYTFSTTAPAHGSLGYAIQAASGEACQLIWTYTGGSGAASLFYYKHPGTPSAASQLATIRNGSGNAAIMSIGTDNKLVLQNALGTNVRVSPTALATNDVVWVTFRALKGTGTTDGTLEYAWGYLGQYVPTDTFMSATVNAGTADMASTRYGRTTGSTWATTMWYDDLETNTSATALIPPLEARAVAVSIDVSAAGATASVAGASAAVAVTTDGAGSAGATATASAAVTAALAGAGQTVPTATGSASVTASTAGTGTTVATPAASAAVSTSLSGDGSVAADAAAFAAIVAELAGEGSVAVDVEYFGLLAIPDRPLPHRLTVTGTTRTLTATSTARTLTVEAP